MEESDNLKIWQQNINASLIAQQDLLKILGKDEYDICVIQEPYLDRMNRTRANPHWIVVYPTTHMTELKKTRTVILVNKKLATDKWEELEVDSGDATAIRLKTDAYTIDLYNIYNHKYDNGVITKVSQAMTKANWNMHSQHIWTGDFNRHHPMWDEERNSHLFTRANLTLAQELLDELQAQQLNMILPKDIPTLRAFSTGNYTRPDNVFCSDNLTNHVTYCNTQPENKPVNTDHMPIVTILDLEMLTTTPEPKLNHSSTDWEKFRKKLKPRLSTTHAPKTIISIKQFNEILTHLNTAIQDTITEVTPTSKPCPYSKRWWNNELTTLRRKLNGLEKDAYRWRLHRWHPVHIEVKECQRKYAATIREAKANHWDQWLAELNETNIWDASKIVKNTASDGGRARVPNLKATPRGEEEEIMARDNDNKAKLFYEEIFPETSKESQKNKNEEAPTAQGAARWKFASITDTQISRAIKRMEPYKATKPGTFPNCIFKQTESLIMPFIGPLYRATFSLEYYPEEWAKTTTIVLKKGEKPDYTTPNAWRPISLSDGLARLLNSCIADDLSHKCETLGILPKNHFGGRPGYNTGDALHFLTNTIKDAWRKEKVVSVLFLDIKGAFPSVVIDKLLEILTSLGIPTEVTSWLKRRYENRKTELRFDDYNSEEFEVNNGLDQGDPLSPLLFMLYNMGLIYIAIIIIGEVILLYIDDTSAVTIGADFIETHAKLEDMLRRNGGILGWATDHNSAFGVKKFQLIDFIRPGATKGITGKGQLININGHLVKPTTIAKYLGIIIDKKLKWKEQQAASLVKGQKWLLQFGRLAKMTKGIRAPYMRKLYLAVAIPRMMYGADLFLTPYRRNKTTAPSIQPTYSTTLIKSMASVQRKAAIMITGAMKTTSTEALDALANLLPFHLLADKIRHQAALRMATLSETHPLRKMVMKATARGYVKSHPSPLHELMFTYNLNPKRLEIISSVRNANRYHRQANVLIASTKEEATQTEDIDMADIKVFTDGSAINGKVGAAAVIYREGRRTKTTWKHLGSDLEHTVHEAECVAILMGLHTIKRWKYKRATIYTDNQAALQGLTASKPGPGKYILDAIHKEISKAAETNGGDRIRLRWIPGHQGVDGNEAADVEAKKAAEGETSPGKDLPKILQKNLPTNKAAEKQRFNKEVKEVREERWKQYTEGRFISKTAPELPSKKHCVKLGELTRKGASIWSQLKTGHVGLNKHLHRIKVVDSPKCAKCKIYDESVEHYLLHCKAYKKEQITMKRRTKGGTKDIGRLLGSQHNAKAVVDYVVETGRLKWTKGKDKEKEVRQQAGRGEQQSERGRNGKRREVGEEGARRTET